MGTDDLFNVRLAFAIVGAAVGFFAGRHARDHYQLEDAPALVSVVGAVLFYFAAYYLSLLLLAVAGYGFCRWAWRCRAAWTPPLASLFRVARRRQSPTSVAKKLSQEQDDFDARTEAILSQPYPPEIKRTILEQLETQHKNRIRELLDCDNSLSGH